MEPAGRSIRELGFAAVGRWLGMVAQGLGGLLIIVEDLQWADADSLALLHELCNRPPPRVALLATLRDDVDADAEALLHKMDTLRSLPVEPLGEDDAVRVVARAAEDAGRALAPQDARRIAADCGGNPYLAELCGRRAGATGELADAETMLRRRVAALSPAALNVLGTVALADGWIPLGTVALALDETPGDVDHVLGDLAAGAMVRYATPAVPAAADDTDGIAELLFAPGELSSLRVDAYHNAVRAAVLLTLDDSRRRKIHVGLARALTQVDAPARRLARHWFGAGDSKRASLYAYQAAKEAEGASAFDLAAQMYAVALEGTPEDGQRPLRKARARCLGLVGRYGDSADEWQRVADASSGEAAADALLEAANAAFADGDLLRGREFLDAGLAVLGEERSAWSRIKALRSGVGFLLGPQKLELARFDDDSGVNRRLARGQQIGVTLGFYDPVAGIHWLRRSQREAAAAGQAGVVAKVDRFCCYFALFTHRNAGSVPLYHRYRESADRWEARGRAGDAEGRALPVFIEGVAAQREARWDHGRAAFDEAQQILESAGHQGSFAWMTLIYHRLQLEMYSESLQRHQHWLHQAEVAFDRGAAQALRVLVLFLPPHTGAAPGPGESGGAHCSLAQVVVAGRAADAAALLRGHVPERLRPVRRALRSGTGSPRRHPQTGPALSAATHHVRRGGGDPGCAVRSPGGAGQSAAGVAAAGHAFRRPRRHRRGDVRSRGMACHGFRQRGSREARPGS